MLGTDAEVSITYQNSKDHLKILLLFYFFSISFVFLIDLIIFFHLVLINKNLFNSVYSYYSELNHIGIFVLENLLTQNYLRFEQDYDNLFLSSYFS